MDQIFKALNDPARRALLDSLRAKDGQTLTELEGTLTLTRFGVMKHLNVLEDANLVLTRKVGRFKYHYLNAVPLQEVIDRWIEPLLAKPQAIALTGLKAQLEGNTMPAAQKPDFIHQTFIRATPEDIWHALIDTAMSRQYYIAGAAVEGDAVKGGRMVWRTADGKPLLSGTVLEADPPHLLDLTFEPHWGGGDRAPSRALYRLVPEGAQTCLTIEHYGIPKGQEGVREGWARIASALKTLLETRVAA
jgi:uncharacterized protein YndB with AHSA1/START domain/DNA-binding transcriptional ArsR family regulator